MAERFSQKNLRVRPSSEEEKIVTNAKKHFEKTLVEISGELVGSVAALEHPTKNQIWGICLNNAKTYIFAQKKILNHPTVILQPFIQKFFINFFLFKVPLKN